MCLTGAGGRGEGGGFDAVGSEEIHLVNGRVVRIGDVLDGDEFVVRPSVDDEGAAIGGGVEAEFFGDDAAVGGVGAVEDGGNRS